MEATFSFNKLSKDRIALNIVTDNMQSLAFLTRAEFLMLFAKMFDYRDANMDDLKEVAGLRSK